MAAVFRVYYLVRPNQNLLSFLSARPDTEILRQANVVCQEQPFPVDHDYAGQTADHETLAKLCYLAGLERARMLSPSDGFGAVWSELLTPLPMTVATFDRWWSLERVGLGFYDLDQLIEDVPVDVLKKIEGPRERSALAEKEVQEQQRRHAENQRADIDEVTGLPPIIRDLPEWPTSVGTWWDNIITRRSQSL